MFAPEQKPKTASNKPHAMPWDPAITPKIICEEIARGKSVVKACEIAGCSHDAFWDNLRKSKDLSDEYARARENRAHTRNEKIEEYTQRLLSGEIDAMTYRALVDTIKWQAGKELAKVYGEKLDVSGIPASQTQIVLPIRERIARMKRANGEPIKPAELPGA